MAPRRLAGLAAILTLLTATSCARVAELVAAEPDGSAATSPPLPATPSPAESVAPSPAPSVGPPSFSVSGNRLVVVNDLGELVTMDAAGGRVLPLDALGDPTVQASQPAWSPDGRMVAWVEVTAPLGAPPSSRLVLADRDGAERRGVALAFAPFFLQWDPTSTRVAYLGNAGSTLGLGVVSIVDGRLTDTAVGTGQPLYLSWAPDGGRILVHVGEDLLGVTDLDGPLSRIAGTSGTFQAPVWLPDGDLLYVTRTGDRQALVVDHDGRRRVLVRFSGGLLFAASPDGERIAYRRDRPGGRSAGVFVAGVEGGAPTRVTRGAATAFFWSPTGDRLLLLTPEGEGDVPLHRWRVWAGRERFVGDPFLPSPTFLRAYLPFFDQYARSLTPWSPDGSAFAYAGLHEGRAGIWVQALDGARERRFVAPGEVVGWAPAPA